MTAKGLHRKWTALSGDAKTAPFSCLPSYAGLRWLEQSRAVLRWVPSPATPFPLLNCHIMPLLLLNLAGCHLARPKALLEWFAMSRRLEQLGIIGIAISIPCQR
ncbi:MAG: hypothetical protein ACLFVN_10635 [Phycisphaeraceae bacterium]